MKDKNVALYGSGARRTVKGGTGSGEVNERHSVSVEEGLIALGCNVLTKGWLDKFDAYYESQRAAWKAEIKQLLKGVSFYQEFGIIASHPFRYPVSVPVEESDLFADETDTAVYVLARQAGEGKDRSDEAGDYRIDALELTDLQVLRKAYKKLVLVINIGGFCDLSFLDEIAPDAVVYLAQAGQAGGKALADILYGVRCPSGKLASTWARTYSDYPCASEYSHYGDALQQYYREGIHVGYRYFDAMGLRPTFAFGHGLSYTSFAIDFASPRIEETRFIIDVKVTNCGACAGKEVVQLYVSLPASAHAEKKRLIAFHKTRELAPEASEETELCFDLKDCSYYDEGRAAWIFPAGDVIVSGGNSTDALRPVAVIRSEREAVTAQCVTIKHFACNNSEDLRDTMNSNVEERALREIYLKGFEIAVKEGHPKVVMTSYNKLNGIYTANNVDLLKTLREEWGFDGIVMTDLSAVREGGADAVQAVRAQNDLIMPGERRQIDMLCEAVENGTLSRGELECCAGRILSIIEENTALPWD